MPGVPTRRAAVVAPRIQVAAQRVQRVVLRLAPGLPLAVVGLVRSTADQVLVDQLPAMVVWLGVAGSYSCGIPTPNPVEPLSYCAIQVTSINRRQIQCVN